MTTRQRLFDLLPGYYRTQDAQTHSLESFFEHLQVGYDVAVEAIDQMYLDLFVETCAEDVLPLIASSLDIHDTSNARLTRNRAVVANALWTRARVGTVVGLERRATDITGWRVTARDDWAELVQTDDVFDAPWAPAVDDLADTTTSPTLLTQARTTSIAPDAPTGPATIDVKVWPRTWFPFRHATLRRTGAGQYTFSPFAIDGPVALQTELAPGRQATSELLGTPTTQTTPTSSTPVVGRIVVDGEPLRVGQLALGDLAHWRRPSRLGEGALAIVDVHRGRLALAPLVGHTEPAVVAADFSIPFGADIGGGAYVSADPDLVPTTMVAQRDGCYPSIFSALANGETTIRIDDNGRYDTPGEIIDIDASTELRIESGTGVRPWVFGDLVVAGKPGSRLVLRGIALVGRLVVEGAVAVELVDCTVWANDDVAVLGGRFDASLTIERSVAGPMHWGGTAVINNSIVADMAQRNSSFGSLQATAATFLGAFTCRGLQASGSLFVGRADVTSLLENRTDRSYFAESTTLEPSHVVDSPRPTGSGVRLISDAFGDPCFGQIDWIETDLLTGGLHDNEVGAYNEARRSSRMTAMKDAMLGDLPPGFSLNIEVGT